MITEPPFFSVVIPTFNRAHSIMDAVESVRYQTFKDFECIIIDDGSTDNTAEILTPLLKSDYRLKYIFQQNAERSAARNHGIKQSKGKYICFLDSDDKYLINHLEVFYQLIEMSADKVAVFFSKTTGSSSTDSPFEEIKPKMETDPINLVLTHTICSQQVCIHRSILDNQRFDETISVAEDQELWSRIVTNHSLISSGVATVMVRDLGDRTIDIRKLDAYKQNLRVKKQIINNDVMNNISKAQAKTMLSAAHYRLADSYLSNNKILQFYWHLTVSIFLSPAIYRREKIKRLLNIT